MPLHDAAAVMMCVLAQTLKPEWVVQGTWAARYNTWSLTPKGVVFSFSFLVQGESRQAPTVGHSSGDSSSSTEMSPTAVEGMLLMAIEKLYKEDRELDVQMGLLRVVLQVLQRHGQS